MIIRDKIYIDTSELGYQVSSICELFTYKNPEIFQKRRLKLSIKNVKPYLYHYKIEDSEGKKILQIPRGGLSKVTKLFKDLKQPLRIADCRVSLPPIDVELEDTTLEEQQIKIIDTLVKNEGGLIQMEPGGGKSISVLGFISLIKQPTLILVHEHRLSTQWMGEIQKRLKGNFTLGKYDGEKKEDGDIVVGIINSIYNRYLEDPDYFNKFGVVVTDECLDPDTIITVPTGIKKLKDLKIGDTIITPTGIAKVKNVWVRKKEAFRYTMSNGNFLIASEDHTMHTFKDFKSGFNRGVKDEKIKNCEGLLFLKDIPQERIYSEFNLINYLYGWFLGDGTCTKFDIKFGFRKIDKIECFEKAFSEYNIFNKKTNTRGDSIYLLDRSIMKQIREKFNIVSGKKSVDIILPDFIYNNTDISFIRGLFEADACRHANSGKLRQNSIELTLTLPNVIYQVSDMLKSLGIYNTISKIKRINPNANLQYRISIPPSYINIFNKKVGWIGYKNVEMSLLKINKSPFSSFKIKSIESLGERELIDIELDDINRHFLANGFISRNCHHVPAEMFLKVVNNIPAKYRIGVTGTVNRRDGNEILLYDVIGPVLLKIDSQDLKHRITDFEYKVVNTNIRMEIPTKNRWTGYERENVLDMTGCVTKLVENKDRNDIILNEIIWCIDNGYFPLVLSDRVSHNELIYERICGFGYKAVLLIGKTRKKTKWEEIREDESIQCIVANSKIASEGLDLPALSALLITCPTTNVHKLKQQIGRIRRVLEGKPTPLLIDFCDNLAYMDTGDGLKHLLHYAAASRIKFYNTLKSEYNS